MGTALGTLSTQEFEELIEHAIDRRLEVWLTQLMDTLVGLQDEENAALTPEFAASLQRAREQARSGEVVGLQAFREQIGQ